MFEGIKKKLKSAVRELIYSEKFERWIRGGTSITGVTVDEDTVFNIGAVYACFNVISQDIGSLPIILYQRTAEGKKRIPNHPLYDILHYNPNPNILPSTFKEFILTNVLARGDGYAEIELDQMGRPLAFWPIMSSRVRPRQIERELYYDIDLGNKVARLPAERIFHVPGLSFNGLNGVTPITKSCEAFGIALANQEHAGRYFRNDASPGYALKHPSNLGPEQYDRLKKEIENMHMGLEKKHRMMLLEGGLDIAKVGLSPVDSQLLEERKFSRSDIAGMFRVPPHMIGDLDRATFSNIEQQDIGYVKHCLRPWMVKFEEAILKRVIPASERKSIFAEFLVDGLLRGDIKARYEAYGIGLDRGFLSVNDVRRFENMNEVENGDKYYKAVNLAPITGGAPQGDPKK